jgi:hypothetical protein
LLEIRADGTDGFALAICSRKRILVTAILPRRTAHDFHLGVSAFPASATQVRKASCFTQIERSLQNNRC